MISFIMFSKNRVIGPSEACDYHDDDQIYCVIQMIKWIILMMIGFISLLRVGSLDHQKPVFIMMMIRFIVFINSFVTGFIWMMLLILYKYDHVMVFIICLFGPQLL